MAYRPYTCYHRPFDTQSVLVCTYCGVCSQLQVPDQKVAFLHVHVLICLFFFSFSRSFKDWSENCFCSHQPISRTVL